VPIPDDARVTWFAPGRVNLIGEHTDYNEGLALPFALERGCGADVRSIEEPALVMRSGQQDGEVRLDLAELRPGVELEPADRWASYVAGAVWAVGADDLSGGIEIEVDADLPVGGGLSSSAALCVSVAGAVADLLGRPVSPAELARLALVAESEFVGAPTGGMDQLAVAFGRQGHAVLCDLRDTTAETVPLALEAEGLAVLVVDTGVAHDHVDGEYAERRRSCERAAERLGLTALRDATEADVDRLDDPLLRRRARHVVTEDDRVRATVGLLRDARLREVGPLLTASHASMRDDFEITVPAVDAAVEALLSAGALGARMTGGGFGGCVLALIDRDRVEPAAEAAVSAVGAHGGEGSWFVARPGDGAHRIPAWPR